MLTEVTEVTETIKKSDKTKASILQAARQLFVEHGFAGASMGKIGKLAGVNHSLLFHHFGNKEKLWIAVKQDITKEAQTKQAVVPSTDLDFASFLGKLIKNTVAFYRNNPDLIRMIQWQRLEGTEATGITSSPEMLDWIEAFKHYQAKGEINSDTAPEFMITMLLSLLVSAVLDPNTYLNTERQQNKYFKFCEQQLLKAFAHH